MRVLGGAKQTKQRFGLVLSKGVKFGVKFNKRRFGAWCCVWCCAGAKQTSKDKVVRV